jgi:ABC-2 type transport system ATP-binding protein
MAADKYDKTEGAMVDAQNLTKSYGKSLYLKGVSLAVPKGGALAIAGENGAGKTTLLKILATASRPDSGELFISGVDALSESSRARELIGYVPQGIALMQELSVRDNLRYWMKAPDEPLYEWALALIGLKEMEKRRVSKLSGGMQRRLNIGASLVLRPSLLILDEPLAGVDIANRRRIIDALIAMKRTGMTIIFTSHYIEEMQLLADSLLALRAGEVTYYGGMSFPDGRSLSDALRHYTA